MINIHDAHVQNALVEMLPEGLRRGIVYASGSTVEGYGNPTSDIDLMCVVDAPEADFAAEDDEVRVFRISDDRLVALTNYLGTAVDIEVITASSVEKLVSDAVDGRRHPGTIPVGELTLVNNLFVGISIGDDSLAAAWRSGLDEEGWRRVLVERGLGAYRACSEDAQGAIAVKSWWSAHHSSLAALDGVVDALSARHGSTNMKPKWRYDRLLKVGLSEIAQEYWSLVCVPSPEVDDVLRLARRRLLVAQRWALMAGSPVSEHRPE